VKRRGFTLVETLVVIAVILILMGILLPVLLRARGKAQQATCISNLMQLGKAMQMWQMDNEGERSTLNLPVDLVPYVSSSKLWRCPLDPAAAGAPDTNPPYTSYVFPSPFRFGRNLPAFARDRDPWHQNGFNVLWPDGSVKWSATAPF